MDELLEKVGKSPRQAKMVNIYNKSDNRKIHVTHFVITSFPVHTGSIFSMMVILKSFV